MSHLTPQGGAISESPKPMTGRWRSAFAHLINSPSARRIGVRRSLVAIPFANKSHHDSFHADKRGGRIRLELQHPRPRALCRMDPGCFNPQQQHRLFQRILGEWAQHDAAAMKQWAASKTVPDDIRWRFLR